MSRDTDPAAVPRARIPDAAEQGTLIEARGLTKHFKVGGALSRRTLHAVDGADFVIGEREIVALVGESGSGKSTIARLLARVYRPTAGDIRYKGRSLSTMRTRRQSMGYRSDVPMVFQDPFSSLNPAYRVSHGLIRGLKLHRPELDARGRRAEAERVVSAVGLSPPTEILDRYPHELSGGQRQRIGFAQALAYRPTLIIADEPVSMLDVSIRIGLLNVMAALRAREGVSFLYITHDLASARYLSDRIMVMYAGHLVETGRTDDVLAGPRHPYTRLLLSAAPDPHAPPPDLAPADSGEPPRIIDPADGCRFLRRCPYAVDVCEVVTPSLRLLGDAHQAACHVAPADEPAGGVPGGDDVSTPDVPATEAGGL